MANPCVLKPLWYCCRLQAHTKAERHVFTQVCEGRGVCLCVLEPVHGNLLILT